MTLDPPRDGSSHVRRNIECKSPATGLPSVPLFWIFYVICVIGIDCAIVALCLHYKVRATQSFVLTRSVRHRLISDKGLRT